METFRFIFDIFLYISEALIVYYYAHTIFEQKFKNSVSLILILLFHAFLFVFYQFDITILNFVLLLVTYLLIFITLYKCNFFTAFLNSILLLAIMLACEWFIIFITSIFLKDDFNAYQNNQFVEIFDIILSKLAYYFICLIIIKVFSRRARYAINKTVFWWLMILPIASSITLFVFRYIAVENQLSNFSNILCSIVSIFLLISNIIVFIIYDYSAQNTAELYALQAIKEKEETEKKYFDIIEKNNNDLKLFTHDIKNHLEQISNLSDNNSVKQYVSKLYGTLNEYSNIGQSGNKNLDIIISKYNTLCNTKNISILFNVKTANLSNVDSVDLSTIFNNLLDNAVEAAEKSEKKQVSVNIYTRKSFAVVNIINSCDVSPKQINHKLLTLKKDKELHGLGISSVQKALKKYDGLFEWEYNENEHIFTVTIAIPNR